jgi:pimeloyl-ACP methyl ester carboxylesterase
MISACSTRLFSSLLSALRRSSRSASRRFILQITSKKTALIRPLLFVSFVAVISIPFNTQAAVLIDHARGGTIIQAPNILGLGVPPGIAIPYSELSTLQAGVYHAVVFFEGLEGCPRGARINAFNAYSWGIDVVGSMGGFSQAWRSSTGGCMQEFYIDPNKMSSGWYWGALSVIDTPNAIADENGIQTFAICDDLESCDKLVPKYPETPLDPVIIMPGLLGSMEKDGRLVMDPILHAYDDLIATFEANGYAASTTIFTFPYNWRNSNIETALLLKQKIDEVKQTCDCPKVDIIAHSMGGLIARQYIQSENYGNDIDQIIFLATPHLGAPKSYLTWEGGIRDRGIDDYITLKIIEQEGEHLGYKDVFDYLRKRPIKSIEELLPIYSYKIDGLTDNLHQYGQDFYPVNVFLENLDSTKDLLMERARVSNIVGNISGSTLGKIISLPADNFFPLWEHGRPQNFSAALILVDGDETVPISSAGYLGINKSIEFTHTDIPDYAIQDVFEILTGKKPAVVIQSPNKINFGFLLILIKSPVDVNIIAPNGQRIGKSFLTNEEINEIPEAFYSGFNTNDEFIVIPNPQQGKYEIKTQGTANGGQYAIEVAGMLGGEVSESAFAGYTTSNLQTSIFLDLNLSASSTIVITPDDLDPPDIHIIGPVEGIYERSQIINISVTFEDNTGISTSSIKFSGKETQNNSIVDLFYERLGMTTIRAEATDFVGNIASSSLDFRITATASSTISDINRAYSLGWIYKERTRDELIKKVERTVRWEKKISEIEEKIGGKKVRKKVERLENRIDKILAKALILELKAYRKDKINEQAYNLIKEDLEWLLINNF